jgi:L-fuconolactonase
VIDGHLVIDAHHHVWRLARGYRWLDPPPLAPIRRDFDVADLRAEAGPAGVDRTVLVEAGRGSAAEVPEFLALAEETDLIAGVVGWVDLTAPDLAGTLAAHRAGPGGRWLVGSRSQVQGEADPDYLGRREVQAGLATVAAAGLAFDLVVRVDQLAGAAAAAAAVPECRLVLDHLGKPGIAAGGHDRWRAELAPLAGRPNVTAKLSGLVTEADWTNWTADDLRPYVSSAVELFGPGRLMFGSDWPVCLLAAPYARVMAALAEALDGLSTELTATERAAVWGGTAARTYRLDLRPGAQPIA